ncbi:hypothetical protein FRC02_007693 [Tulasnella sp. 418]|nr:hypothetical protein FRC02_007693 [Tulasnella sp. 418]
MTFSVSRDNGSFEWAGKNPFTLFCQLRNLFNPQVYRMVWDILRFNVTSSAIISRGDEEKEFGGLSLGEYLHKEQYSEAFVNNYMLPMTASIWSTPPHLCALDFPARNQIRFLYNHHLLQLISKPPWLTIDGGSQVYVNRIISTLPPAQLHLSTPIQSVASYQAYESASGYRIVLTTADGKTEEFDHIVLATHSDISLKLLQNGSDAFPVNPEALPVSKLEKRVLSGFGWAKNEVVLHNDIDLMPKRKIAWSCWNFLTTSSVDDNGRIKSNMDQVSLVYAYRKLKFGSACCRTYDMNQLQHISEEEHGKVLVTLNPLQGPRPETIISRQSFEHPIYNAESVWAQENLPRIQNTKGITFAGAWCKHGFHEDGFTAGMVVATKYLDATPPFKILSADRPAMNEGATLAKVFEWFELWRRCIVFWFLMIIGWIGGSLWYGKTRVGDQLLS